MNPFFLVLCVGIRFAFALFVSTTVRHCSLPSGTRTLHCWFSTLTVAICPACTMTKDNCTVSTICSCNTPAGVAVSLEGRVCFSEINEDSICTVTSDGTVTILAGDDSAALSHPCGVAFDGDGSIIVAEQP